MRISLLLFIYFLLIPAHLMAEETIHMPEDPGDNPQNLPADAEYLSELNMWITSEKASQSDVISEESVTRRHSDIALNDPYTYRQWPLDTYSFEEAFPYEKEASNTVTVAVIDSGVSAVHPDLKGKVRSDGYNFIDDNTNTRDTNGHGTRVAGVIAANSGNGIGVTGYTGNYDIDILPIKIMDKEGKGTSSDIIRAVNFALENNADILHLSLGSDTYSRAEERTMELAADQGAIVIASAGNEGNSSRMYPASHDSVFSVGSLNDNLTHSDFSNYNSSVDFAAPGEYIFTTDPGGTYSYQSGTSFSAPLFTSIAAMVASIDPDLSMEEVEDIMKEAAVDLGTPGKDVYYGYGTVFPAVAVREALFERFSEAMTVEEDKTWTVTFNQPVAPSSLEGNVYVTDQKGNKERISISYADEFIRVAPPFFGYERNRSYTLYVEDDIRTESGETINTAVQQEFVIR
ncbi:S8 family peptidase [Salimicrobium halophilum]|uniref:Subtilase family protein n=1 Tax=Salimicrobium halophilum TaxID=86666 RepID=A0A1G8S516_9BACI|nr:S8 family serine peptidase [Salimicrobium halophilum]SDJ24319.1 Subtilase family protein [Salimicrobium halophilum]